jgi:hypothetical protein
MTYHSNALALSGDEAQTVSGQISEAIAAVERNWPADKQHYEPAAMWTILDNSMALSGQVVNLAIKLASDPSHVFISGQIASTTGRLQATQETLSTYVTKIRKAQSDNLKAVIAPNFRRDVLALLLQTRRTYESLMYLQEIQPAVLKISGGLLRLLAAIGHAANFLGGFVPKPPDLGGLAAFLKWGTIASGLFGLYWILKPKKAR